MLLASYKRPIQYQDTLPHGNLFIASMTTAYARLELYKCMDSLGRRLLYTDTDSVIYTTNHRTEKSLVLGNFLGELTNEIPSGYITEFASCGPKNYSYRVKDLRGNGNYDVVKVKGFTLKARTCKKINFTNMRKMVLYNATLPDIQTEIPKKIKRNVKKTSQITTSAMHKTFRLVYNKRFLLPDKISTVPFGWK